MKRILILTFVMALATAMAEAKTTPAKKAKAAAGIQFTEGKWKQILEKAKKEKKMIFFDAYASWCGPCKTMQKYVFTQPNVGEFYNKNFVNVKIDMEEGEGPQLAAMYPLSAYPTLFFMDSNGKVIKKSVGGLDPDALINLGKSVLKK